MVKKSKSKSVERVAEAKTARGDMSAYAEVASGFKAVRPAASVIRQVEAVPTIFPDFDDAVKVGGWPLARVGLIHGPSAEGKSPMLIGIMRSFVEAGHFANFGDFERATPEQWARALMGPVAWEHPAFGAVPPTVHTYEDVRVMHRQWAESIANAREAGKLPTGTTGVFGIDSIRKLLPKNIWDELAKASKSDALEKQVAETKTVNGRKKKQGGRYGAKPKGQDGAGGRAGQIKAHHLSVWFDELVPLLAATNTSMVIITRETDNLEAEWNEDTFKIAGGKSLLYESSLWIRVTSSPVIVEEDGGVRDLVGTRHSVGIRRSKVSARANKVDHCCFHTSNGKVTPLGFDRARDLFELGRKNGVIELSGSFYKILDRKAQGEAKALALVRECEREVEAECRKVMAEERAKEDAKALAAMGLPAPPAE